MRKKDIMLQHQTKHPRVAILVRMPKNLLLALQKKQQKSKDSKKPSINCLICAGLEKLYGIN